MDWANRFKKFLVSVTYLFWSLCYRKKDISSCLFFGAWNFERDLSTDVACTRCSISWTAPNFTPICLPKNFRNWGKLPRNRHYMAEIGAKWFDCGKGNWVCWIFPVGIALFQCHCFFFPSHFTQRGLSPLFQAVKRWHCDTPPLIRSAHQCGNKKKTMKGLHEPFRSIFYLTISAGFFIIFKKK